MRTYTDPYHSLPRIAFYVIRLIPFHDGLEIEQMRADVFLSSSDRNNQKNPGITNRKIFFQIRQEMNRSVFCLSVLRSEACGW